MVGMNCGDGMASDINAKQNIGIGFRSLQSATSTPSIGLDSVVTVGAMSGMNVSQTASGSTFVGAYSSDCSNAVDNAIDDGLVCVGNNVGRCVYNKTIGRCATTINSDGNTQYHCHYIPAYSTLLGYGIHCDGTSQTGQVVLANELFHKT